MEKQRTTWAEVERLTTRLARRLAGERFDGIVGILRGGLPPACLLSQHFNLRPVLAIRRQPRTR